MTRNNADITQVELARHCHTDITMTSQVLRTLEKKGYIIRHQKKGNARSKFSQLTSKGAHLIERAIPLVESVDRDFFKTLGRNEKKFIEILEALKKEL